MPEPRIPTLPVERSTRDSRRSRTLRRAGLAGLALILVAGLLSLLGVRSGTTGATGGGYTLTVTYPVVTRAGAAAPFDVRLERSGGFERAITIAVPRRMLARFDFQSLYPTPSAETGTPDYVYLTFDPPPGDVFALSADVRTSADENGSFERYRVAVISGGRLVVGVSFRMVVMP
jgi:hypothetical protein